MSWAGCRLGCFAVDADALQKRTVRRHHVVGKLKRRRFHSRSSMLRTPGEPGEPCGHLGADRRSDGLGAALLERDLPAHPPILPSTGVTQNPPGAAFSGKGPCADLPNPKVEHKHRSAVCGHWQLGPLLGPLGGPARWAAPIAGPGPAGDSEVRLGSIPQPTRMPRPPLAVATVTAAASAGGAVRLHL